MAHSSLSTDTFFKDLLTTRRSFAELISDTVRESPNQTLLHFEGQSWTVADVYARACHYVSAFKSHELQAGQQVAVMLNNHPDHVAVIVALGMCGLVWIPLDRRYRAANISSVLQQVHVALAVVEDEFMEALSKSGYQGAVLSKSAIEKDSNTVTETAQNSGYKTPEHSAIRSIMFTSGSTGSPKGVQVTEQMFLASGLFCAKAADANASAIFYVWEPLNHIGGAQLIPMALATGATLALTKQFSVSRYWEEVVACGATRLHYLGGVLDLLLSAEPTEFDQAHSVTLGFGAGASIKSADRFKERFGVDLREVYGMTEASSFTSINFSGVPGSIGTPLPCFELVLVDADGLEYEGEGIGEVTLCNVSDQLITPGYYDNPTATLAAFKNNRFFTGDIARRDSSGHLYFVGRNKEIIRCKGENISPWEIEQALLKNDAVKEVAVLGTHTDTGDQEIVAFIVAHSSAKIFDGDELARMLIKDISLFLADFQIPRYIVLVDSFPKTPSQRVEKHRLDTSDSALACAWDRLNGTC